MKTATAPHSSRVFIAHQDAQTAQHACQILKDAGFHTRWAASGQATLDALKLTPTDMLLLDLRLAEPACVEIVRQIKAAMLQGSGLLLLTMEDHTLSREELQGLATGADGCLAGPLRGPGFLAQVQAFDRLQQQARHWENYAEASELQRQELVCQHETDQQRLNHLQTIQHSLETALARARTEEFQARQIARMLEGLLNAIPDIIGVLDSQRRVIQYNAAGYQFLNVTPEEARGRYCYEILGRSQPCSVCASAQSIQTRQPAQLEKYVPELNSWLDIRAYPVLDEQGQVLYLIEHLRDITAQKNAEQALQESEERLRLALTTAKEGLYDLNVVTGEAVVSPEYALMLGYDPETFRETNAAWRERLHPDDREAVYSAYMDYISGRRPDYRVEFRQRTRSGEWVWILSVGKIVKYDDQGRPLRMIGTHTDITAQRQNEAEQQKLRAQLAQAQKMESIGRLAGGVAHDFNNMLQAILGNTALLLQDLPEESPLKEYLVEIEEAAQRSADLTRQLLAFARKQTIAPQVLNLNDTVGGLLKMLRRLIGEHIELEWKPGAELWPVCMDTGQLDQILANLCLNSRDAIAGQGVITIETANVTLDATYVKSHAEALPGDYVLLAVSDTGAGMDAETRNHLFEPFFTTKEPGKGTGLGLATVFGIVKQNHGLINVYSEPGAGATFKIYLPRAENNCSPATEVHGQKLRHGEETVLVVEDEVQVLVLAQRILAHYGYQVLAASTPAAAMQLAGRHPGPIHLLITDVVMPGMHGKELYQQLLDSRPGLRCLYMSGYTANVIAHQGILDPGVNFVQKPFTVQSLLGKLAEALDSPAPGPTGG